MPSPDPARRSDRSHQAILRAARELLLEVGFARVTIEGIASRAGVGKQTIYRWWPSRSAVVFDAVLERTAGSGDAPPLPDTGDLAADLRIVTGAIAGELRDPEVDRLQRTVIAEIQHDETLAAELVGRLLGPQMQLIADRLRAAQTAGELRADIDIDLAVEQLVGPLFHRWLLRTRPLREADAHRLVDQLLGGLAQAAPSRR